MFIALKGKELPSTNLLCKCLQGQGWAGAEATGQECNPSLSHVWQKCNHLPSWCFTSFNNWCICWFGLVFNLAARNHHVVRGLPQSQSSLGLERLKPGARDSIRISHVSGRHSTLESSAACCLPGD